ncbi:metallophosphoesterase [Anaerosporobacter sp.]
MKILIIIITLIFCIVALWQGLTVKRYRITSNKLKSSVRIMALTDLHSTIYGKKQKKLINKIREYDPDVIVLVGDIAVDDKPHEGTELLLSVIAKEYPCYYVTGNHEFKSGEVMYIKDMIRGYGVTILEGSSDFIDVNGQKIQLFGVDDPNRFDGSVYFEDEITDEWREQLNRCKEELTEGVYSILLSHRPELTEIYKDSGFDLVIAGHAHGGQVRIPGIVNGLFAPNQGLFPKYAGGLYEIGATTMIVSRGLCRNIIPRVFNPPEIVVIDLVPLK